MANRSSPYAFDLQVMEEWRSRIRTRMGYPSVDLHLTEGALDSAIRVSLQLWDRHKPVAKWKDFVTQASVTTIIDFGIATPNGKSDGVPINRVVAVRHKTLRSLVGAQAAPLPFGELYWDARGPRSYFELRYQEQLQTYFTGTQFDWRYNEDEQKLYIYSPRQPHQVMALVTRRVMLEDIQQGDEHLFERYAVAHARQLQGQVQNQLGPIPVSGGSVTPNYDYQLQQAEKDIQHVEETLRSMPSTAPMPRWM